MYDLKSRYLLVTFSLDLLNKINEKTNVNLEN